MSKTLKYIHPSVNLREEKFRRILENIHKESYHIMDSDYYQVYSLTEVKNFYFIVANSLGHFDNSKGYYVKPKEVAVKEFKDNITKLKEFNFFITSYKVKGDIYREVLVLELPKVVIDGDVQNTAKNFLEGNYSKLWTQEQLEIMFAPIESSSGSKYILAENQRREEIKGILSKDPRFKHLYVKNIKDKFDTNISEEEVGDIELDIPAKYCSEEILNNSNVLYQVGILELKDIKKSPQTITSEDLV